jgi:hypothetical protein
VKRRDYVDVPPPPPDYVDSPNDQDHLDAPAPDDVEQADFSDLGGGLGASPAAESHTFPAILDARGEKVGPWAPPVA